MILNRHIVRWRIRRLREERDVAGLIGILSEKKVQGSGLLRIYAVHSLGKVGDQRACGPLSHIAVSDTNAAIRGTAAKSLGQIGDSAAIPVLRRMLEDEDEEKANHMWAIRSLGLLRDRGSVSSLVELLKASDVGLREFTAYALGDIGDHEATLPLIGALTDRRTSVRRAAAMSLAKLGDSRALVPVRLAHENAKGFSRRRIGRALGELEARFG